MDTTGDTAFIDAAADRQDRADLARLAKKNQEQTYQPDYVPVTDASRKSLGKAPSVASSVSGTTSVRSKAEKSKPKAVGKAAGPSKSSKRKETPGEKLPTIPKRPKIKTSEMFPSDQWPEGFKDWQLDCMTRQEVISLMQRETKEKNLTSKTKKTLPGQ